MKFFIWFPRAANELIIKIPHRDFVPCSTFSLAVVVPIHRRAWLRKKAGWRERRFRRGVALKRWSTSMAFSTSSFLAGVGTVFAAVTIGFAGGAMIATSPKVEPNRVERVAASARDNTPITASTTNTAAMPDASVTLRERRRGRRPLRRPPPAPPAGSLHRDCSGSLGRSPTRLDDGRSACFGSADPGTDQRLGQRAGGYFLSITAGRGPRRCLGDGQAEAGRGVEEGEGAPGPGASGAQKTSGDPGRRQCGEADEAGRRFTASDSAGGRPTGPRPALWLLR